MYSESLLIGIGHPLLDLLAYVDNSFLDKYSTLKLFFILIKFVKFLVIHKCSLPIILCLDII